MKGKEKKKFNIAVTYMSWGVVEVEASTIEEARQIALKGSLPIHAEYVEDSIRIDKEYKS